MSMEADLLRAVIDNPDDDAPRLVYSDWLDENGDPERAEFIRVQCELAQLAEDDPRRGKLERRERQLIRVYGCLWWPNPFDAGSKRAGFRRGFAEAMSLNLRDFVGQADRYFEQCPLLRELDLHCEDRNLIRPLASMVHIARLKILRLHLAYFRVADARALATSPFMDRLILFLNVASLDNDHRETIRDILHGRFGARLHYTEPEALFPW